jgi:hypothetical protein
MSGVSRHGGRGGEASRGLMEQIRAGFPAGQSDRPHIDFFY